MNLGSEKGQDFFLFKEMVGANGRIILRKKTLFISFPSTWNIT